MNRQFIGKTANIIGFVCHDKWYTGTEPRVPARAGGGKGG